MEYHRSTAAIPAANIKISSSTSRNRKLFPLLRSGLSRQILPQNHHRGHRIDSIFRVGGPAGLFSALMCLLTHKLEEQLFLQVALGFPTAQALYPLFYRADHLFAD